MTVLAVVALMGMLAGCGAPAHAAGCVAGAPERVAANVSCRTVTVDGHPREFVVYRPPNLTGPAPVVFMFHGSTGTAVQFLRTSGWREKADEEGFIAVFPQGLEYLVLDSGRRSTKWNDFSLAGQVDLAKRPAGYPPAAPWPADDVGFTRQMIDDLSGAYPVDPDRIFVSGFSNGAGFAARLAVELSDRVAAVAASGGTLAEVHTPVRPIPTWLTVGNEDDRVLELLGSAPPATIPMRPADLLADPVLGRFLDVQVATVDLAGPPTDVTESPTRTSLRWTGATEFRFDLLRGLGHNYPVGTNNDARFVAADEFWEFFVAVS